MSDWATGPLTAEAVTYAIARMQARARIKARILDILEPLPKDQQLIVLADCYVEYESMTKAAREAT